MYAGITVHEFPFTVTKSGLLWLAVSEVAASIVMLIQAIHIQSRSYSHLYSSVPSLQCASLSLDLLYIQSSFVPTTTLCTLPLPFHTYTPIIHPAHRLRPTAMFQKVSDKFHRKQQSTNKQPISPGLYFAKPAGGGVSAQQQQQQQPVQQNSQPAPQFTSSLEAYVWVFSLVL